MHKTKYRKTTYARPPGVKSDPRWGKSKFLEKRLSPTAQTHYANLEDTGRDSHEGWYHCKVHHKRYRGKKNEGWGHI